MKQLLAIGIAVFLGLTGAQAAEDADAAPPVIRDGYDADLNDFLWVNRLVAVFADSPADPRFAQQLSYLEAEVEALALRDVVVLTDTDPSAKSAIRQALRPRGFMMVLIAKNGDVYLRKPLPWTVREISHSIDKLPMRQQEMRDRRAPAISAPQ